MRWIDQKVDNFIRHMRDTKQCIPIGRTEYDPTYWRFFLIPRNPYVNFYLHNFRHDDAEDLHDHRMFNISFILQGEYYDEHYVVRPTPGMPLPPTEKTLRKRYSLTFRRAASPHRVVLRRGLITQEIPCWSLFIGFRHVRNWGFWCPGNGAARWAPHEKYTASADPLSASYGQVGRGCDE